MSIATERRAQVSVQIGNQEISFETGHLAKQADGAVVVRGGDTMVLATAQGRAEAREGADFFPLTVDVEERMYAAGKIPGGFFKREGRPTERAILTARMIDRPIRPLWPKGFRNEVQVICTVLSADMVTAHDILCINGASAALMLSPLPFLGPVGAVRIGLIDGELVVNPTLRESEDDAELDLIVVGTKDGLTMVEAGANEVPEEKILEALELAHGEIVKLCEAQEDLRRQAGKPKWLDLDLLAELERDQGARDLGAHPAGRHQGVRRGRRGAPRRARAGRSRWSRPTTTSSARCRSSRRSALLLEKQRAVAVEGPVREQFGDELKALTDAEQDSKALKSAKRQLLFDRIVEEVDLPFPVGGASVDPDTGEPLPASKDSQTKSQVKKACESIYKDLVRQKIAVDKRRPDGRGAEEIRPIEVEVGVNPRAHGSGLFTRGQTQILSSLTLGTAKEGQRIDDLSLEEERRYMHHYNFPPYSVGETGFMRGPKRRDIGHGALAQRALEAVIPTPEEFPYTIRIVSETLESNGSSSMGSVCGSTLSLMDAGVPIKAPVSGIAMGLVKEGDDYVILTDIQGAEDHLGDMDFKVAGTRDGITALQMDIKITGVTPGDHARRARAGEAGARVHPREDARGHPGVARGALRQRAADHDDQDRPGEDRHGHRQGRRDDPRPRVRLRGADRHRGGRHDPHLRHRGHEGQGGGRRDRVAHEGARGRRHVHRQGREDDPVRRVRRAEEGHRRAAPRLERRPGPGRAHRGRDEPRRRRRRRRAGGRQGPRPDRPQARREARERRPRPAGGADRAGEGRAAAASGGGAARAATAAAAGRGRGRG